MGRPSIFTQELADTICERLAEGESLRRVCLDPDMPARSAVLRWLAADAAFQGQYARACEVRAEAIFDEMFDIADDGSNDWMEARDDDGGVSYRLNGEHVQRSRLRVDARKWALSKMMPKKYGDKLDLSSTDGTMTPKPVTLAMTPQEAAEAYAAAIDPAGK